MAKGNYRSKLSLLAASTLGVGISLIPTASASAMGAVPPVTCAGGTISNPGAGVCALIDGETTWWGTYTGFNNLPIQNGVLWCGDGFNNGKFFPNPTYNYVPSGVPNTVNQQYLSGVGYALSYLDTFGINGVTATSNDGAVAGRLLIWDLLYNIAPSGASTTQMSIYNQLLAIAKDPNAGKYNNAPTATVTFTTVGADPNKLVANQSYNTSVTLTDSNGIPYANVPVTLNITGGYFNAAGNPTSITLMTNAQGFIPILTFTPNTNNAAGSISISNTAVPSNGLQWYSPTAAGVNAQDGIGAGGALPVIGNLAFGTVAPEGQIQIQKSGNDPARSVQGAVFTVHDNTNAAIADQQLTIGANGVSQVSSFYPSGDRLSVTETTTPADYQAAPAQTVTVTSNQTLMVNFADQVIPATVTVNKVGNDPARSVQGAVFTVTDGTHQDGTLTVGANGATNTLSLAPDVSYTVTETTTPADYQAAPAQTFTPTPGQNEVLNFADQVIPATVTVNKVGNDPARSVQGAVFTVTDGTHQDGTLTVGANGATNTLSLAPDVSYTVTETTTPADYQAAPAQTFTPTPGQNEVLNFADQVIPATVTVNKVGNDPARSVQGAVFTVTDGTHQDGTLTVGANGATNTLSLAPDVAYTVTETKVPADYQAAPAQTFTPTPGQNEVLNFADQVIPATVTVNKVGNDPARSVQGAVFTVTDGTHQDGTLTVGANGLTNILSLAPDVAYTVTETKVPADYQAAPAQTFTPTPGQNEVLNFADQVIPATLQIKKQGNDQDFLPVTGAVFQVENSQGTVLDTLTIGSNGMSQISSPLQPDQKLTLHEEKAPAGYQSAPDQVVTLTPGAQDVVFTFNDQAIPGQLTIKKVSTSTGQALQGATFKVTDSQGNLVATVTTGSDGTVTVPNLIPGNYTVSEVNAPSGYKLSATISASVQPGNDVVVTDSDSPLIPASGIGTNTVAPSANTVTVPSANTGALWANPVTYFGGASITGLSGGLIAFVGRRKRKNKNQEN